MSAKTRSGKVIDLRKRKPGSSGTLSFNWGGSHATRPKPARQSPLKARRRRTRILFALGLFTVLFVSAYAANWISYLPRLTIATVNVSGTEALSPRIVEAYVEADLYNGESEFISRHNIFLYPRKALEAHLLEFVPRIKSAKVSREGLLAQAVRVTVAERETEGQWCTGEAGMETCYLLDETGFVFAPASLTEGTPYTFKGVLPGQGSPVGQTFLPRDFPAVSSFLEALNKAGFKALGALLESEEDIFIPLVRGYVVRAALGGDYQKVIRDLELVLSSDALRGKESQLEYVDLRFGNRVYYKFENSEEASVE